MNLVYCVYNNLLIMISIFILYYIHYIVSWPIVLWNNLPSARYPGKNSTVMISIRSRAQTLIQHSNNVQRTSPYLVLHLFHIFNLWMKKINFVNTALLSTNFKKNGLKRAQKLSRDETLNKSFSRMTVSRTNWQRKKLWKWEYVAENCKLANI